MKPATSRLESIDQFRGLAIALMVLANYLGPIGWIPAWMKHSKDVGLTPTDLVAPLFIFAIGLTYGLSFRRRLQRDGANNTYQHFFTRWMAVVGIGALMSAGAVAATGDVNAYWGVLQAIGLAGLVTLLFLRLPTIWRLATGLMLLALYQFLLDRFLLEDIRNAAHGGLYGGISWAAMLILATVLADVFHSRRGQPWAFPATSLVTLAMGVGMGVLLPISKHRVSASYVLISLGVSAVFFALLDALHHRLGWRLPILTAWGKNPLFLYLLHYVLIGLFVLPGIPALHQSAPPAVVLAEIAILFVTLSWIAATLERKQWYFSL
jgi:predicted acyltransferase